MPIELEKLTVNNKASIKEALKKIDTNAQGICFVTDNEFKLTGVVTDGDIRRALLAGYNIKTKVQEIMTKNYVSLPFHATNQQIQEILNDKVRHIPLINEEGKLVDYAFKYKYHHIPISEPSLKGNELAYVTDCINTNWISSQGKYVIRFEEIVADYIKMPFSLAVCNGTVGLHLALKSLGIGAGDEIILPDLTFAATINAVLYCGATPVIVDVNKDTWNIDTDEIEKKITNRTKAILPVHLYGLPANMLNICNLTKKYGLYIVEDAAEAIGSEINNKKVGGFGDISVFSFFGNKTITTGEGGMVLFKDKNIFEKAMILRDHGMSKTQRYWHDYVGYNYRMTNLQAAIGFAQMERIDNIIKRKIEIGYLYRQKLKNTEEINFQQDGDNMTNTYWLNSFIIDNTSISIDRDEFIKILLLSGIEARPVFYPLHKMPPYKNYGTNQLKNSEFVSKRGISLPSFINIENNDINFIVNTIKKIITQSKKNKSEYEDLGC